MMIRDEHQERYFINDKSFERWKMQNDTANEEINYAGFIIRRGTLIKYIGKDRIVSIPDCIHAISNYAFQYNKEIECVGFPDSIISVGAYAFVGCSNLSCIELNDGLERIDLRAFALCKSLKECIMPDSITVLGEYIFENCTNLETVHFSNMIKVIPRGMFNSCERLKNIDFPINSFRVEEYAFNNCKSIECLSFLGGADIDDKAFYNCTGIRTIIVDSAEDRIRMGTLMIKGAFASSNIDIRVVNYSEICSNIVDGVWTIRSLLSIDYLDMSKRDSISAIIIDGLAEIPMESFAGMKQLERVEIKEGIKYVGFGVFANCKRLTTVLLPSSVTYIGCRVFEGCSNLVDISIPDSVEYIGDYAFAGSGVSLIRVPKHCIVGPGNPQTELYFCQQDEL